MTNRAVFALLAWTATAAIAVGGGLAAIAEVGAGITDRNVKPMTPQQVKAALAEPAAPSSSSSPSSSPDVPSPTRTIRRPGPTVTVTARVTPAGLASDGGVVLAVCNQGGAPYLVSWTPLQGFSVSAVQRMPPGAVFVQFESATRQITMAVTCRGGKPSAAVTVRFRRHNHDGH
jgi:hypothetical protein